MDKNLSRREASCVYTAVGRVRICTARLWHQSKRSQKLLLSLTRIQLCPPFFPEEEEEKIHRRSLFYISSLFSFVCRSLCNSTISIFLFSFSSSFSSSSHNLLSRKLTDMDGPGWSTDRLRASDKLFVMSRSEWSHRRSCPDQPTDSSGRFRSHVVHKQPAGGLAVRPEKIK